MKYHLNDHKNYNLLLQKKTLKTIKSFQIQGHFLLIFKHQKITSQFYLKQVSPNKYLIELINPIGQIQSKIYINNDIFTITNYNKTINIQNVLQAPFLKINNFCFPLNCLNKWILGIPCNINNNNLKKENTNNFKYVYKNKIWNIRYLRYLDNSLTILPILISIKEKNIFLKIHISHWDLK